MQGWIKLHRQITENRFYFAERFTRVQAFIDLLLLANHREASVRIRGIEIKLNPGELCYSQLTLSKRWKLNRRTVARYLSFFESENMISFRANRVTTVIKIVNWQLYQGNEVISRGNNSELELCKTPKSTQQNPAVCAQQNYFENEAESKDLKLFGNNDAQQNMGKLHNKVHNKVHTNNNNYNGKNILYNEILEFWNSKEIVRHRKLTDNQIKAIRKVLKDYSEEEVISAIDNYSRIVKGEEYYFNHRWTLEAFLIRGIEKFSDLEIAKNNYSIKSHSQLTLDKAFTNNSIQPLSGRMFT